MRGRVDSQGDVFHTFHVEDLIPTDHPLRSIKSRVDAILCSMSRRFNRAYGKTGRPSIPPERLIKALLLQSIYSIRSEIQICEQVGYNLLFRWFLDMNPSDKVWTPEVYSMNRARFAEHGFIRDFFDRVVREAILEDLASEDHCSVDGSLIESFASMKSLRPMNTTDEKVSDGSDNDDSGNPTVNFRGQKRSNHTHRSIVDPEARLKRKGPGKPALLSHSLHVLMENRHGLCLDVAVDEANGYCERKQAIEMLRRVSRNHGLRPRTLGADGGYSASTFLERLESKNIKPHIPMPANKIRGIHPKAEIRRRNRRRSHTQGYAISQRIRKRIEEIIGWCKDVGGLARARFVGRWRIRQQSEITAAAYNLIRMARLAPSG